jgi:alkylhydroperoxidase family enzyme
MRPASALTVPHVHCRYWAPNESARDEDNSFLDPCLVRASAVGPLLLVLAEWEKEAPMSLVPHLEREEVAADHPFDTAEKLVGRVLNFHKVVAHSPHALRGFLAMSEALRQMKLDRKLRELAYLRAAQINGCQY